MGPGTGAPSLSLPACAGYISACVGGIPVGVGCVVVGGIPACVGGIPVCVGGIPAWLLLSRRLGLCGGRAASDLLPAFVLIKSQASMIWKNADQPIKFVELCACIPRCMQTRMPGYTIF